MRLELTTIDYHLIVNFIKIKVFEYFFILTGLINLEFFSAQRGIQQEINFKSKHGVEAKSYEAVSILLFMYLTLYIFFFIKLKK